MMSVHHLTSSNQWNFVRLKLLHEMARVSLAEFTRNDAQVIVMYNVFASSFIAVLKFFSVVSASKLSLAVALMLWHQVVYCNGYYRLCLIARPLPLLALELWIHLNFRYWMTRLSRLAFHTKSRNTLPSVPSTDFLRCRDGHTIFDFFKTLSLSGISPPAIA
jgi:hypothetical protein